MHVQIKGMADDLLGVSRQLGNGSTGISRPKLTDQYNYMNAADHDHAI